MAIATAPARRGWYRCEVVDIHAEMAYWKNEIHTHPFYEQGTPFSRYEPVLRFAYDAYLRYYAQPLEEVLERIHHKYVEQFDQWHGLAWSHVEPLLQEVWIRMGAPTNGMHTGWRNPRNDRYMH